MKNKYINFSNKFYKILSGITFSIFLLILILILVNNEDLISFPIIFIGFISYVLLLVFLYRKFDKMKTKTHDKIAIFLGILSLLLLLIWGLSHKILFKIDLSHIVDKVQILLNQNTHIVGQYDYFSKYPHQIHLFSIIYFIMLFGKTIFNNPENVMIIYNCIMISLSIYFIYKIAKELFDSKIALIGMLLAFLYPYFYLLASYYYTDIVALPFGIIGLYCLIKANREEKVKKILHLILGGVFFAIGSRIRVTTSFLLIAYVIDLILKGNIKEIAKKCIPIFLAFTSIYFLYNKAVISYFQIQIDDTRTLPFTYFVMTGLNSKTNGKFNQADLDSTSLHNDKIKYNLSEITNRLKKTSFEFYTDKLSTTWTDSSFEILNYNTDTLSTDDSNTYLTNYNSIFIKYILKIMRFTIYSLFVITIGNQLTKKQNIKKSNVSIFIISMLGGLLFYLFWESLDRYSFSFFPTIIIGGCSGIVFIDQFLKIKKLSLNDTKFQLYGLKKNFGIIVLIFLAILLFDGFIKYSVRKEELDIIYLDKYNYSSSLAIMEGNVVEYFTIDKSFNKIGLIFYDTNIKKEIPYIFELYDNNDNLIYKEKFMSKIGKGKYDKVFKFEKVEVNEKQKYHFKIYSEEANDKNFLTIAIQRIDNCVDQSLIYENQGYDFNPVGETYVNDNLICHDISYRVYENKIDNKIKKLYYIPFAITVFMISFLGIYTCLIKKQK